MYNKTVFDNGLKVITSTMPHTRSVCLVILVGSGSCHENPEEAGISHFIEHLLFKGTQQRPTSKDISQDIEGVGGIINASTDKEVTVLWCKVAKDHFPIALDVLSDLLLNSRFNSKDIEQERNIIIEEINMNMDLPQRRVNMLIDELLWPEQPLGREIAGEKNTVTSITREQMLNYITRRYVSNNIVISVAGNLGHEEVISQIVPLFSSWAFKKALNGYSSDDKQTAKRLRVEARECEQAHLCLATHGLSYSHPKRFVLDLLNIVLGGGMSSRLFMEIREHKGLAYDIHSYTDHFLESGSFVVYAGVNPEKLEIAVSAIVEELYKLKQEITLEELTRAKELCKGRLQLRLEDTQNMALWLGSQEMLQQRILNVDEVISIIDAIVIDELKEVAEEIITDDGLNLAVVGPVKNENNLLGILKQ
ncbi:MAG: pitrilysin family protein [Chloroflexota bacterium]|nr:pitrilysin family protein [Chloroflexota bacterium]